MIDQFEHLIDIPFDANGVNCYELLRKAYKTFNIFIPPTDISVCACKQVSNKEIKDRIKLEWERIPKPEIPCGVIITPSDLSSALHIATYIGQGKILHITKNINSMIENLKPKYKTRIFGFYRFIGNKK